MKNQVKKTKPKDKEKQAKVKGKPQSRKILTTKVSEEIKKAVTEGGLKLQWVRFIDAYIANGGNATKAYQTAYSTPEKEVKTSTACANASRLLTNANIIEEINNKLTTQGCTEDFIISGLVEIATKYRGEKTINAAVKSFEILAKMKGMLVDTKKLSFTGENPAVFVPVYTAEEKKEFDKIKDSKQRIVE